ncbi:MAG: hypothetical protein AAF581_12290 [Planctomycetota bacterium]
MLPWLILAIELYQGALVLWVLAGWVRWPAAASTAPTTRRWFLLFATPLRWLRQTWPLRFAGVDYAPVYLFALLEITIRTLEVWGETS